MKKFVWRWVPISVIVLLFLSTYFSGIVDVVSWENFRQLHRDAFTYAEQHVVLAPFLFMVVYIIYASLSLPGIVFLSILAGCIFVQPLSTFYVVGSATIGASILFLSARTAVGGEMFLEKLTPSLGKMEEGIRKNVVSYLLFLRLMPVFPFWVVNLVPAFFKVSFWTFFWTTFVGILPASFVFTQVGAGLSVIVESAEPLNISTIFNIQMKISLAGLGFLSLLPILFKYLGVTK